MHQTEKLTALYCRVAHTDENMITAQTEYLRRYAEKHGYKNISVYADNGCSGLSFVRPAFSAMEADIRAGKIQTIIARDISRIGRDHIATAVWIDRLIASGVALITMDCSPPVSAMMEIYAALR